MRTLILSDLHLGNGGDYDTFAGGAALPALLDAACAQPTHVILNGDSVDFLMNDDPLELSAGRAAAQAAALCAAPATAVVLRALGRALAVGGEVTIRLGNHDAELALVEVQETLRAALAQPVAIAARLRFERGEQPALLDIGGARVLVTHGEHCDPWNRVDYRNLPGPGAAGDGAAFTYAPGSRLVKTLMNPLKKVYGMRFIDLLKPDFQGAVLTALAVNPGAVRTIFQGSTATLLLQLCRNLSAPPSFSLESEGEQEDLGLTAALYGAGLDPDETEALAAFLDPEALESFASEDGGALDRARSKLGRAGLRLYAAAQRTLAGDEGERFFTLAPGAAEWADARRLAHKYGVAAVVIGHSHAARFHAEDGVTLVNTGTWIWLMQLPPGDASDDEWSRFLELCRKNPRLDPARGEVVPLRTRFTAALIEPVEGGGAELALVEWQDGALRQLAARRLAPAETSR